MRYSIFWLPPPPFCKYCNIGAYRNDELFGLSKKEIEEWT